jgi:predicted negative regulator of RcsB-dependent stress response
MTPEHQAAADATIAATAGKATYGGAATSIFGWFTSNEFAVLVGTVLAIAGFIVNWYYRHKEDKRQQAEHDRRMGLYE